MFDKRKMYVVIVLVDILVRGVSGRVAVRLRRVNAGRTQHIFTAIEIMLLRLKAKECRAVLP